ncbi:NB-ARC domain-containing protein [Kitasatospora sp. NBC_00315]
MLLEPNRVVPVARLVEATWDEEPPATASHQVRKIVADLRQRIPGGAGVILTDGPGYRAAVEEDQLDLTLFQAGLRAARVAAAAGSRTDAAARLRSALDLWRGPVLAGGGGAVIEAASAALEERRLAATEQLFGLRLALGESADLVGDLRELVQRHPLRETARGQLMTALYRGGRQAEALEEYGRVRELLVEELGIDPGSDLTKLYEAILRNSPELAAPAPPAVEEQAASTAPRPGTAPCSLPYDLLDFTGRAAELAQLLDAAAAPAGSGTRIITIDGMGGGGKTALAVRGAHQLAEQYPDGQLYIDLRGFTPGQPPLEPGTVLDILLRTLGLPGERIPDDLISRIALWRVTTAQRRLLVVLDNAVDTEQVRSLLPASPGCLVLITSRVRLMNLDGAQSLSIGRLSAADGGALVERTLGAERVAAEPEAAEELVRLCGQLPLALRISTARLRNRPRWTIQYLVDRLRDETRTLDELSSGDRSVAASLRLSYLAMEEDCRRALRLLGLHPGGDLDGYVAAALLGTDLFEAEDLLELLLDAHLLEQYELGRYTFHDLVRSFAHSLRESDTAEEDDRARERLMDYYVLAVEGACEVLFPGRVRFDVALPEPVGRLPLIGNTDSALDWFEREHQNLLAAVRLAGRRGLNRQAAYLPRGFASFLHMQGYPDELLEVGQIAVAASRRLGNKVLLRLSLSNLAVGYWQFGRLTEGIDCLDQALEIAVEIGDRNGEAACLGSLGTFHNTLGQYAAGLHRMEQALLLHRELESPREEAATLIGVSSARVLLGRYADAARAAQGAVELTRRLGELDYEALALVNLANAHTGLGEYREALAGLAEAQELYRKLHRPAEAGLAMARLADVHHRMGDGPRARELALRAGDLVGKGGSAVRRATVDNIVGRIRSGLGEHRPALECHRRAYGLAQEIGFRIEMANAVAGMATASAALGDSAAAEAHRAEATGLFDEMGIPQECRRLD